MVIDGKTIIMHESIISKVRLNEQLTLQNYARQLISYVKHM